MVVYADILLAINFAVDFVMLKGASHFCGKRIKNFRMILGAAVGAASSMIIFFPTVSELGLFFYRIIAALAVSATAFCPCRAKKLFKCSFMLLLQSFVLSGMLMLWQVTAAPSGVVSYGGAVYFDIGIPALIICSVMGYIAACLLSGILARKFAAEQFCDITIINSGTSATFTALIDTGNSLVEPFSGDPVIVCELGALRAAVPPEIESFDLEQEVHGKIRLIPYKTVDSGGLLPAFMPEKLLIKRPEGKMISAESCYIAVTTARLGEEYRAICNPKALLNDEKVGDAVYESKY